MDSSRILGFPAENFFKNFFLRSLQELPLTISPGIPSENFFSSYWEFPYDLLLLISPGVVAEDSSRRSCGRFLQKFLPGIPAVIPLRSVPSEFGMKTPQGLFFLHETLSGTPPRVLSLNYFKSYFWEFLMEFDPEIP